MKSIHLLFVQIILGNLLFSQTHFEQRSAIDHLIEVNKEWLQHDYKINESLSFQSDEDRISFHLINVIARLRETPVDLNTTSAKNRIQLLDELESYAKAKQFPMNIYHSERRPYFIDHEGTACAVGYMMIRSGHEGLALKIKDEHNYDYLEDIKTEGVEEWADEFGFSLAELAWVQPTYAPSVPWCQIGEGVNDEISCMSFTYTRIYLSGPFDSINGTIPCPTGLAYIEGDMLFCMEERPAGPINDIQRAGVDGVALIGQFELNGQSGAIAEFIDEEWQLYEIPERLEAIGIRLERSFFSTHRYLLAIDPQDGTGNHEIWNYNAIENTWTLITTTFGTILTHSSWTFGGVFSAYIDHQNNDQLIETKNLVSLDLSNATSETSEPFLSEFIPDTVKCIAHSGSVMYVGGSGDSEFPNPLCSRYQGESFQQLLYFNQETTFQPTIYDLAVSDEYDLIFACNFNTGNSLFFGHGLGSYNPLNGDVAPMAYANNSIKHIVESGDELYIGGPFTTMNGLTQYNGLAKICEATGLIENDNDISLFPNPTSGPLRIESQHQSLTIEIYNQSYQLLQKFENNSNKIDLSPFSKGSYILRIITEKGVVTRKIQRI